MKSDVINTGKRRKHAPDGTILFLYLKNFPDSTCISLSNSFLSENGCDKYQKNGENMFQIGPFYSIISKISPIPLAYSFLAAFLSETSCHEHGKNAGENMLWNETFYYII